MITKFSSASPPSFVKTHEFTAGVMGSWATIGNNDIRLSDGDYLISLTVNGVTEYSLVTASEYASNSEARRLVVREVAEELLEDIIQAFVDLSTTDLIKLDILRTIGPAMDMIIANKLQASSVIAGVIATTANFTQGRKTVLINMINEAITQL